jgi:tRNA threonylcarbamoyladenosine biosynthesis protein TsaE
VTAPNTVHRVYTTRSAEETIALGRELAALLAPSRVLIVRGDLGAGKTTLVKGIAAALDAAEPDEVTSPTFTLIHEYPGVSQFHGRGQRAGAAVTLYHLDLYRIDDEKQLETLGIDDLITPESIVLIEWGEKFPSIAARSNGEIAIETLTGDERRVSVTLAAA